jgi:hypothetical protein
MNHRQPSGDTRPASRARTAASVRFRAPRRMREDRTARFTRSTDVFRDRAISRSVSPAATDDRTAASKGGRAGRCRSGRASGGGTGVRRGPSVSTSTLARHIGHRNVNVRRTRIAGATGPESPGLTPTSRARAVPGWRNTSQPPPTSSAAGRRSSPLGHPVPRPPSISPTRDALLRPGRSRPARGEPCSRRPARRPADRSRVVPASTARWRPSAIHVAGRPPSSPGSRAGTNEGGSFVVTAHRWGGVWAGGCSVAKMRPSRIRSTRSAYRTASASWVATRQPVPARAADPRSRKTRRVQTVSW